MNPEIKPSFTLGKLLQVNHSLMNKNVIGTDAFFFFLIMHFSSRLGICILVNNSKSKGGIKERKTVLGGGEVSLERPEKY